MVGNYRSKNSKIKKFNERNYAKNDAKKADRNIYFCTSCNTCWEIIGKNQGYSKNSVSYYENFPTYGKIKKQCIRCKGETNGKFIRRSIGNKTKGENV